MIHHIKFIKYLNNNYITKTMTTSLNKKNIEYEKDQSDKKQIKDIIKTSTLETILSNLAYIKKSPVSNESIKQLNPKYDPNVSLDQILKKIEKHQNDNPITLEEISNLYKKTYPQLEKYNIVNPTEMDKLAKGDTIIYSPYYGKISKVCVITNLIYETKLIEQNIIDLLKNHAVDLVENKEYHEDYFKQCEKPDYELSNERDYRLDPLDEHDYNLFNEYGETNLTCHIQQTTPITIITKILNRDHIYNISPDDNFIFVLDRNLKKSTKKQTFFITNEIKICENATKKIDQNIGKKIFEGQNMPYDPIDEANEVIKKYNYHDKTSPKKISDMPIKKELSITKQKKKVTKTPKK